MATFNNAQAFARHVTQTATVMEHAQTEAIARAALTGKECLLNAPGAPHTVARKRVSVNYTITSKGNRAEAIVQWRGPVHLVDRDTAAHEITARAKRGVGAALGGGLAAEVGHPVRSAMHPGTHGKHFFAAGEAAAATAIPAVLSTTYGTALARHFR